MRETVYNAGNVSCHVLEIYQPDMFIGRMCTVVPIADPGRPCHQDSALERIEQPWLAIRVIALGLLRPHLPVPLDCHVIEALRVEMRA